MRGKEKANSEREREHYQLRNIAPFNESLKVRVMAKINNYSN